MQKNIWTLFFLFLSSCASSQRSTRHPHPVNQIEFEKLPRVQWNFSTTELILSSPYTPFYIDQNQLSLYSGGPGPNPENGVFKMIYELNNRNEISRNKFIATGPDPKNYNYFRAPRVARLRDEVWMLIEVAECYSGCDTSKIPRRLAIYQSKRNGDDWEFLNFLNVDGKIYDGQWMAHTGLIINPDGSNKIETEDLTKNKFITIGENRNILVSADGVNYRSFAIEHPFPKDRLVFASIARTPFGFHLTSASNWDVNYFTTTIRHLFSKDLRHWIPIEFSSAMKNPKHFKGVHLSFDDATKKLWAISSCGNKQACGLMGWIEAKDYSLVASATQKPVTIPIGEYVAIDNQTAMVIALSQKDEQPVYKIRFADGAIESDVPEQRLTRILEKYKQLGCTENQAQACVGDPVQIDEGFASIVGFDDTEFENIKYAIKLLDGNVLTEVSSSRLKFP